MKTTTGSSNHKRFLIITALALFYLGLWLIPITRVWFDLLDKNTFYFLNSTLEYGNAWRMFWAITNMRAFDIVSGFVLFLLLIAHIKHGESKEPVKRFIRFCIYIGIIVIVNKVLYAKVLELIAYERASPSLVFKDTILLSDYIKDIKFRDSSSQCFPGDHAAVLVGTVIYFLLYDKKIFGTISAIFILPFIIPRLAVGAHWLTDCFVGSVFVLILIVNIWVNVGVGKKINSLLKCHAAILLSYLLLTIGLTWPLTAQLTTHIPGEATISTRLDDRAEELLPKDFCH